MKKVTFLFFLIMFIIGTDTFLISPLLPTLKNVYHISTDLSGLLVSAYAMGYALFALIAGPVSDRFNRKRVMILGLIAFASATCLCGFATTFAMMIVCRFLAGVSAAFITPQVWASIPMLIERNSVLKVMGYATAGLSISQMLGIPIGSYLAQFSWQTPFYVIALCSILLIICTILTLPSIPSNNIKSNIQQGVFVQYIHLFKQPRVTSYIFAYFIFQTGNFATFSFIGTWFSSHFSLNITSVGTSMIALGLGNTIGSLFGSHIVRRIGQPYSLLTGFLLLILLYATLPFAATLIIAETILAVAFMVAGFIFPIFMSTFQQLTTTARGTISSLSNAAMYAGTTIGGAIGGILFAHMSGMTGLAYFSVLLYLFSMLLYKKAGIFQRQTGSKEEITLQKTP